MKVYQLKIQATDKLKVPSDENAAHITSNLLKDSEFKKNLSDSIDFSKTQMHRPTQQLLLKQAQDALKKDGNLSSSDKVAVYKALNLSLTFHNKEQIAVQNKFYGEMKKKGYNALLDYNDKDFSSYHAKRPMIVFDLDSVTLKSVAPTNQKVVDKMYTRYNTERLLKEIPANTVSYIGRYSGKKVSDCRDYVNRKRDNYLQ